MKNTLYANQMKKLKDDLAYAVSKKNAANFETGCYIDKKEVQEKINVLELKKNLMTIPKANQNKLAEN